MDKTEVSSIQRISLKKIFLVTFYASPITSHNLPYVLFTFLIKFSKFKKDRFFIVFTHIESMDIPSNIMASTESYIFLKRFQNSMGMIIVSFNDISVLLNTKLEEA